MKYAADNYVFGVIEIYGGAVNEIQCICRYFDVDELKAIQSWAQLYNLDH